MFINIGISVYNLNSKNNKYKKNSTAKLCDSWIAMLTCAL